MSNTLVERVARTMAENNVKERQDWSKLQEYQRDWWRSDARLAVAICLEEMAEVLENVADKMEHEKNQNGDELLARSIADKFRGLGK